MAANDARASSTPLIERRSIDYIPEAERHGRLLSQFTLWMGANLQITAIVTGALAVVHRGAALQVRQGEVALAVAAVGGSKQGKQGRVLRNGQNLPATKRPAYGCEVEAKNPDFRDEWVCHD